MGFEPRLQLALALHVGLQTAECRQAGLKLGHTRRLHLGVFCRFAPLGICHRQLGFVLQQGLFGFQALRLQHGQLTRQLLQQVGIGPLDGLALLLQAFAAQCELL